MHMHGGDCQFSARGATQAQRAVETDLFVLEGLAGSYVLNSRSQNDPRGGPRTIRRYSAADAVTTSLMSCRIRREANQQSRAHPSSPAPQINSSKRHRWRSIGQ